MRRIAAATLAASLLTLALVHGQAPSSPPSTFDIVEKDIADLQMALREGRVTSAQLVDLYFERIGKYDKKGPAINAFITLNSSAHQQAEALDRERQAGRVRGPLHGIPLVIKDNYLTSEMPTTAGTLALEGFDPGVDAFQVRKLREAGAVFLGKSNLTELAVGITTVSSAGGQTLNPYDRSRNPGGSSGGTAAAVASSFGPAGMGTDTCGSIRIPAAQTGLWGLRPTMGLSSRTGVVPLSHSQDVAGPIARSVADLALLLDATVGVDTADAVTESGRGQIPATYMGAMGDSSLVNVQIGVVDSLMGRAPEDEEVRHVVSQAVDVLSGMGAGTVDVDLDTDNLLRETSAIDQDFKADLHAFLDMHRAPVRSLDEILRWGLYRTEFDNTLRRRNESEGPDSPAAREVNARRAAAIAAVKGLMQSRGLTLLAYPTIRRKAAKVELPQLGSNCQLSATTGWPAISMPAGFTEDGLPVGIELLGLPFTEGTLLRVAYAYERLAHPRRPPKLD